LLATTRPVITVSVVNRFARHKALTLVDSVAVLAILSFMVLAGKVAYDSVLASARDTLAQAALTEFAAAQGLRHETLGSFKSDPATANEILGSYSFVDASTSSTSHKVISFETGSSGAEDFFVAATLSPSGRCFLLKHFESASAVADEKWFFEEGVVVCSAAAAAVASGGVPW
jgi:Tfp pilus assembly protein PilE